MNYECGAQTGTIRPSSLEPTPVIEGPVTTMKQRIACQGYSRIASTFEKRITNQRVVEELCVDGHFPHTSIVETYRQSRASGSIGILRDNHTTHLMFNQLDVALRTKNEHAQHCNAQHACQHCSYSTSKKEVKEHVAGKCSMLTARCARPLGFHDILSTPSGPVRHPRCSRRRR